MKKIKKIFAVLLSVILCFSIFVSCGDPAASDEEKRIAGYEKLLSSHNPVEITVWHYYTGKIYASFKKLISEFNETVGAEKGIAVSEASRSNAAELSRSIIAAKNQEVGADQLPDIIQAYTDTVFAVGQVSGVVNLEKYFRKSEIEQYVESYIAEGRVGSNNALQILPTAKSSEALVLNKKAWDAFALQENNSVTLNDLKTIEGLNEVSQKFRARYNKTFIGRDSFANYMIVGLKQLGYDIFTQTESGITVCEEKSAYKKLWDSMYKPVLNGLYACGTGFRTDEMQSEQIIAYIGSTASAGYIPAEIKQVQGEKVTGEGRYDNEVAILPLPVFAGKDKVNVQQGAGLSVLSSNEKKEYASAVFLKWFTENERNLRFATETGYSPVKKAVSGFDVIGQSDIYNSDATDPNVKKMLEVSCAMNEDYTFYFTKGFEKGASIRDTLLSTKDYSDTAVLKVSMDYRCVSDPKKIANGTATLDSFLDDSNFENWYADLITAIKTKINE